VEGFAAADKLIQQYATQGGASLASTPQGADVVQAHVTRVKNLNTVLNSSLTPDQKQSLVAQLRDIGATMGGFNFGLREGLAPGGKSLNEEIALKLKAENAPLWQAIEAFTQNVLAALKPQGGAAPENPQASTTGGGGPKPQGSTEQPDVKQQLAQLPEAPGQGASPDDFKAKNIARFVALLSIADSKANGGNGDKNVSEQEIKLLLRNGEVSVEDKEQLESFIARAKLGAEGKPIAEINELLKKLSPAMLQ
jgi:hypothetical protein